MTQPATDDEIERMGREVATTNERALIARIRHEQELASSIREETIRECAELARLATENDGYAFSNYVKNVVLGVVPPKKAPERKP